MQTKFPNLGNFENENLVSLLKNYKSLERKGKDSFFHHKTNTVLFPEINELIQQKTTSTTLWLILIDFLISYSYQFRFPIALFSFFKVIDDDVENLGESLEQMQEHNVVKEVILVKLVNQYFLILQIDANTYIVDYAGIDETQLKQVCNFLLEQPSEEIRLIQKQIAKDSSPLLFQFLCLFVSGRKIPSILLNEYDLSISLNREIWFFLRMGFNEIDRVFKEGLEYEEEQKQQRIVEHQRRRLQSQIRNQRKEEIEPQKQVYRLRTPLDAEDLAEQQKLLKERMAYLKVLCGEGNDEDILQSEMFQLRKTNLEAQVDEELKQLDTLKQQQIMYSGNPLLRNASELLKGKFNENLFKNLGLEIPDDFNKSSMLRSLKQQNYDSILKPLIEKRQPIPGVFVAPEHIKNIVNYRYNIKITREELNKLRKGSISIGIVNFYLNFLGEYCQQYRVNAKFMMVEYFADIQSEIRMGKKILKQENILGQYENIYFPIKIGEIDEYSLIMVDVNNLKIHHYYLFGWKNQIAPNSLQQIYKQWNVKSDEELERKLSRQEMQEKIIQVIIYWIRRQCQMFKIHTNDMKLWKIRIQDINYVQSPTQCGFYLLTLISSMILQKHKIDDLKQYQIYIQIYSHSQGYC